MAETYKISLKQFVDELGMEVVYTPCDTSEIFVTNNDINRPALQLAGFFEYFNTEKLQMCGNTEYAYLAGLDSETRAERMDQLFSYKFPALIMCMNRDPFPEMIEAAKKHHVALLKTAYGSSYLIARGIGYLNVELAERITRHGVLIEIYGEGVLIVGESGVGKSETAIELVKRGHRLVADDAVEIKKVSAISLVGSSPENIRHFIELRGIGIVNVRRLYGMGAIKTSERIDLVVKLEQWDPERFYDRMGVDSEYTNILGVNVPSITIPVKPGRNLAVILEVAAMNAREKKMGYNAAQELLGNLGLEMEGTETVSNWTDL